MAFNPKDLGAYKEFLDTQSKISKVMSRSSKDFAVGIKDAVVAKRDLAKAQKQLNKLEQEELELQKQINKAQGEEKKLLQEKLNLVQQEKKETEKIVEQQKALASALSSQVGSVKNLTLAIGRDLFKGIGKVVVKAKQLGKEFREADDAMRRTAVNIGLAGKQFNTLRRNAYKASLVTQQIGMGAKEVVEMYGSYVNEVGRAIPMTEKSAKAMAFMAKGTALGAEGAAQMAASMEVMGYSMESTAGYVEDVTNMASKLGVDAGKTIKLIQTNLRKAQTVNFRGGVEAMGKMAAKAISLRADMAATLGLAQDLWEPEKAIETAASLQMMGGAFAKMADPLKLMFDARNNPEKLMTDLANAAAQSVKGVNGVYSISSLELTRLREVAKATGQDFETIVETAKTAAKQNDIGKMLNPKIKGEQREFIKNIAQFKDGSFKVEVDGDPVEVAKLTQKQIEAMMSQEKSLKKRAEEAQSFMTRLSNLMTSLKALAGRFFSGLEEGLRPILDAFKGDAGFQKLGDQLENLGKSLGNWIATIGIPFIRSAIPLIQAAVGKLTEMVGNSSKWLNEKLIPITKVVLEKLGAFWAENGTFIKELLVAAGKLSKAVWTFLKFLGPEGALAAILLVKFPAILRGAISMLTGGLRGIGSMFGGGGRGSSPMNPMFVQMAGGMGGMGGPMDMMGMGMPGSRYKLGFGGRMLKGMGNMLGGRRTMLGRGFRGLAARSMGYTGGFMKGGVAGASKLFGRSAMGAAGRAGVGGGAALGIGGRLARGMGAGGPLALLGVGAEVGRMFMDDPDSTMGKTLGVLGTTASDAATGMMIGSLLGPLGTAVGGIIGGIVGFGRSMYREITTKGKSDFDMGGAMSNISKNQLATAGTSYMGDGQISPGGAVIKSSRGTFFTDKKDYITASTNNPLAGGGGGNVNVNISGTINLSGGGTSVSMDGLLKDPVFKAEVTKVVIEGMKNNNR